MKGDLLDLPALTQAMSGSELVFHLAANADVRFGPEHPRKDLEQNTIATWNVLEAMRASGARRIVFASTGSVYGEPDVFPTPEEAPFPVQTSLYAASKLAAEGMLSAYAAAFGFQVYIFRFVSILGERYTHGHVFDFYKQLLAHPDRLHVLGNGQPAEVVPVCARLHQWILLALEKAQAAVNIFNLGTDEYCEVNDSIGWISEALHLVPALTYAGGERGWIGDSPFIFLDCCRIRELGWKPSLTIREGILRTLSFLDRNRELLEVSV